MGLGLVSVSVSVPGSRSGLGLRPVHLPEHRATHEVHRLDETRVRADIDSDALAAARSSAAAEDLVRVRVR